MKNILLLLKDGNFIIKIYIFISIALSLSFYFLYQLVNITGILTLIFFSATIALLSFLITKTNKPNSEQYISLGVLFSLTSVLYFLVFLTDIIIITLRATPEFLSLKYYIIASIAFFLTIFASLLFVLGLTQFIYNPFIKKTLIELFEGEK